VRTRREFGAQLEAGPQAGRRGDDGYYAEAKEAKEAKEAEEAEKAAKREGTVKRWILRR